jgi:hypothetical protein
MHHDLVCDVLCLDLRGRWSVPALRWVSARELRRPSDIARSRRMSTMTSATWRTITWMSPVVYCDVVRGVSSPSTRVRIRFPHLGHGALPLFLLRGAACHGHFLEIQFRVMGAGRRNFVRPFAVEAAGNATAWIDTLEGLRVIRKDTFTLGTLVVVWRGPTRREGRGLWFSRN